MTELETGTIPYETRRYGTRRRYERILQEEEKIMHKYIKRMRGDDTEKRRGEERREERRREEKRREEEKRKRREDEY